MKLLFGKIYLRGVAGKFAYAKPRKKKNPTAHRCQAVAWWYAVFSSSFGAKYLCSPGIYCAEAHCVVSCVVTTCVHSVSWDKELLVSIEKAEVSPNLFQSMATQTTDGMQEEGGQGEELEMSTW